MATDLEGVISRCRLTPEDLEQLRQESQEGASAQRTAVEETWWQRERREEREAARAKREGKE